MKNLHIIINKTILRLIFITIMFLKFKENNIFIFTHLYIFLIRFF